MKTANGVTVELQIDPSKVIAGEEADVPIHFADEKTGEPVKNLQRYLGAFGHAMMLSEDMTEHVHAHPEEMLEGTTITDGGGPDLVFHALFPKPGHYRIWLQFQRNDMLSTVPFTVRVLRAGETACSRSDRASDGCASQRARRSGCRSSAVITSRVPAGSATGSFKT